MGDSTCILNGHARHHIIDRLYGPPIEYLSLFCDARIVVAPPLASLGCLGSHEKVHLAENFNIAKLNNNTYEFMGSIMDHVLFDHSGRQRLRSKPLVFFFDSPLLYAMYLRVTCVCCC